jgi:hypothetical protein
MLLPLLGDVLDRILPDDKAKEQAKLEMLKLAQEGRTIELNAIRDVDVAQNKINEVAANSTPFAANARPAALWVCVFALGYQYVTLPFLTWYSTIQAIPLPPPIMNDDLWLIITGLLGLGVMRSYEKTKKVY